MWAKFFLPMGNEDKYEEVSKLTVKPFEDEAWRSHLTFTIKGKEYTWSMSNYSLLKLIEDHLSKSCGLREYNRIHE